MLSLEKDKKKTKMHYTSMRLVEEAENEKSVF
jgi:hypothetical protein